MRKNENNRVNRWKYIVICTNTMHKVASIIQKDINIPILHIAEATADELIRSGVKTVALLGKRMCHCLYLTQRRFMPV